MEDNIEVDITYQYGKGSGKVVTYSGEIHIRYGKAGRYIRIQYATPDKLPPDEALADALKAVKEILYT